MLSGLCPDQEHVVNCVIARIGGTVPGRLAIADIVADHRPATAVTAVRAASVLASLPGCSVFLTVDGHGGYLAFGRDGGRFSIRRAPDHDGAIPAAAAEAWAVVLYTLAQAGRIPSS